MSSPGAPILVLDSGLGGLTVAKALRAALPHEDVLYFGDTVIDRPELQLPHPRMHLRRFVLAPLADIRPDLILPRQTESVHVLLVRLVDKSAVVRVADLLV